MIKMVINNGYGGYGLDGSQKFSEIVYEQNRFALELVEFVENHPGIYGDLAVVLIPEDATDYYINEYNGLERVIYVLNGKIRFVEVCDEDDDGE